MKKKTIKPEPVQTINNYEAMLKLDHSLQPGSIEVLTICATAISKIVSMFQPGAINIHHCIFDAKGMRHTGEATVSMSDTTEK